MNILRYRDVFLPIALEHVMEHLIEPDREEMFDDLTDAFNANAFDAILARIRRSNVADQVEKILRIFQQCEILWRGDPDDSDHSWALGIATGLRFENDVVEIEVITSSTAYFWFPINKVEDHFRKCPLCEQEGEDGYIPIIPEEAEYHLAEVHGH